MAESFLLQAYLDLGWYIFPIKSESKEPATFNGFKDASNDPSQIQLWVKQHPNCNWAVATGASRLLVIDIDMYKGGTLSSIEQHTGKLLTRVIVASPSGGCHFYYSLPEGVEAKSHNSLLPAVDVRADTGYVLLPPSCLNGVSYTWDGSPLAADLSPAPPQLIEFINTFKGPRAPLPSSVGEELYLKAGQGRWEQIRKFAGRLRNWGWNFNSIYCAVTSFVRTQCEPDPSISDQKIKDMVQYICSRPPKSWQQNDEAVVVKYDGRVVKIPRRLLTNALLQGAVVMKEIY